MNIIIKCVGKQNKTTKFKSINENDHDHPKSILNSKKLTDFTLLYLNLIFTLHRDRVAFCKFSLNGVCSVQLILVLPSSRSDRGRFGGGGIGGGIGMTIWFCWWWWLFTPGPELVVAIFISPAAYFPSMESQKHEVTNRWI